MIKWDQAQRYAPYQSYSPAYLADLQKQQRQSAWHQGYHIQPTSGLINDPNGFAYFNHQWHLFKQQFPFGPVHGLKSWGHLTSADLNHWSDLGTALTPHAPYTTHGVYSGSALPVKDQLFLMYTGNVRTPAGGRKSTQLGAWMTKNGQITELPAPLIAAPPSGYTAHFRDPQVLKHAGAYYALIGAQRTDRKGQILVYKAPAPTGPWRLIGPLDFGRTTLGYMIECPNLTLVDGKVVLLFCPQGMEQAVCPYPNRYPNTYVVAAGIDWQRAALIAPGPVQLLDGGFDNYAAQVARGPRGESLVVSWMGLPDVTYPSDQEDWQGCYSLVRRLHIQNGRLTQMPLDAPLVGAPFAPLRDKLNLQEKLTISIPATRSGRIWLGNAQEGLTLVVDGTANTLTIDRSQAGVPFAEDAKATRTLRLAPGPHTFTLWLDHSSFELAVDCGQAFASGRIFPRDPTHWRLSCDAALGANISGQRLAL